MTWRKWHFWTHFSLIITRINQPGKLGIWSVHFNLQSGEVITQCPRSVPSRIIQTSLTCPIVSQHRFPFVHSATWILQKIPFWKTWLHSKLVVLFWLTNVQRIYIALRTFILPYVHSRAVLSLQRACKSSSDMVRVKVGKWKEDVFIHTITVLHVIPCCCSSTCMCFCKRALPVCVECGERRTICGWLLETIAAWAEKLT